LDAATEAEGLTALALGQLLRRRAVPRDAPAESPASEGAAQQERDRSWLASASSVTT
jgi:hypothetical protein